MRFEKFLSFETKNFRTWNCQNLKKILEFAKQMN